MDVQYTDDERAAESSEGGAWRLMFGFVAPMVAKAICQLKVPDILAQSQEPLTAAQIVERMPNISNGAHDVAADSLGRMMRYLAAQGVFTVVHVSRPPEKQPCYSLSPVSKMLMEGSSSSLRSLLLYQLCTPVVDTLQHLADLVTRGTQPCEALHGTDLWELLRSEPEVSRLFNSAMADASCVTMDAFLSRYRGLDGFRGTLVDVGGGIGATASRIVERYPTNIRAINFDQPHVIANAPTYPGVEHLGGDMFQTVPKGDIMFLKWILHDWGDEDCIKILKNCHKALPENGKLIIVDVVIDLPNDAFPSVTMGMDIVMMGHTKGKERTIQEWEAILKASRFSLYKIFRLSCPPCAIEAHPDRN